MEWPREWMWASMATAVASLVVPALLPAAKRRFSLLILACAMATYGTYEWIVQSRAPHVGALIRVDLLVIWPVLAAGALACIGAFRNRHAPKGKGRG